MPWEQSRIASLERFTVLSPHLDDAAFSLGATIARATRAVAEVTVLTVMGGDPSSRAPAGEWDHRCGFSTAGEAVRARRAEEARACRILGARSVQLGLGDEQYSDEVQREASWVALEPSLAEAEAVLIPGWPLVHDDHQWVSRLALERLPERVHVGLYVDQPYAVWETVGPPGVVPRIGRRLQQAVRSPRAARRQRPGVAEVLGRRAQEASWEAGSADLSALGVKLRAMRAYESQLRGFGKLFLPQILLYAWADGGEPIGWIR